MASKKVGDWFVSDTGRKFAYVAAAGLSTLTIFGYYLPNTIYLEKYKEIIHLYSNGLPVPVSAKLEGRFQKTLDLLQIKPEDQQLYKPFHVYGFDVMSAGSSYSKFGNIIGLPVNFTYENPNTIDKSKIKIGDESIVWDSEAGQNLLKSLVVSENAQIYAMAREILYRQTPKPLLDVMYSVNFVLMSYGLSSFINQKFNFYAKPRMVRICLYFIVGLFSAGVYAMSTDMTQIHYEEKIDKELKSINKIFIEGGKEYYEKLLERNKALRFILGKEGERRYSVLGNENYLFRHKHIPLLQRKDNFEEQLAS